MTDVVETDVTTDVDDVTSSDAGSRTDVRDAGEAVDAADVASALPGTADGFVSARAMEDDVEPLFAGDTGVLPFAARRALALVMQRRYVSAAAHPAEWKALLAHQNVLSSRCHDLFVELVVDRDYEIAYKRQVREDGLSVPVLLKDEPYKRVETLLMLLARNRFRQEQGAGERTALLDAEELVDYASGFLAQDETNLAARRREIDNAIAALVREHVLTEVATGRYRVEPVVEILLPVERLRELTAWLRDGGTPSGEPGAAGAGDDTEAVDEDEETSA